MKGIEDRVIKSNVQMFVDNWKMCERALVEGGYRSSDDSTYIAAKKIMRDGYGAFDDIRTGGVDDANLQRMLDIYEDGGTISHVTMRYPVMGNFKAFYYKMQDKEMQGYLEEYEEGQFAGMETRIDALDKLKMSINKTEPLYEKVCKELKALEAVQDFMDASDEASYQINQRVQAHMNAMKAELRRSKHKLLAKDYLELEERRAGQLRDLCNRVSMVIEIMLSISEN